MKRVVLEESSNEYSFNFRKFKELKKRIEKFLLERYWNDIVQEIFKDKEFKEAFYKNVLWFSGSTDVFNSGRRKDIIEFWQYKTVKDIVDEVKEYVMENLYKK